jgi:4-cresol dehydrogenase (hydroxylating)
MLSSSVLEAVITVHFALDEGAHRAHECVRAMSSALMARGYLPYRVSIDQMDQIIRRDDPFWQTVARIKGALDPGGILSPGRYCP